MLHRSFDREAHDEIAGGGKPVEELHLCSAGIVVMILIGTVTDHEISGQMLGLGHGITHGFIKSED